MFPIVTQWGHTVRSGVQEASFLSKQPLWALCLSGLGDQSLDRRENILNFEVSSIIKSDKERELGKCFVQWQIIRTDLRACALGQICAPAQKFLSEDQQKWTNAGRREPACLLDVSLEVFWFSLVTHRSTVRYACTCPIPVIIYLCPHPIPYHLW